VIETHIGADVAESQLNVIAPPLKLTAKEFATIAALAREEFGLELGPGKEQLVAARLGKLMRQRGVKVFGDYYQHVQSDRSGDALVELIDALTTNHTSFFREQAHFDFLVQRIFVEQKGNGPMRIWSAASSTGEEPYTIALTAREHILGQKSGQKHGSQGVILPRILATDISTRVLETARRGMYKAERFQGGLAPWLKKHLLRGEGRWLGWYRMRPEILGMVEFRRLNLIEPLPPDVGRFTVIFCRNVMIYFSRETQEQLVNRLAECLEPGGYLFVGHSESLTGIQHPLQQVQPAVYRKRGARK
jgi:chemotaxis protein methyltransferase CheR